MSSFPFNVFTISPFMYELRTYAIESQTNKINIIKSIYMIMCSFSYLEQIIIKFADVCLFCWHIFVHMTSIYKFGSFEYLCLVCESTDSRLKFWNRKTLFPVYIITIKKPYIWFRLLYTTTCYEYMRYKLNLRLLYIYSFIVRMTNTDNNQFMSLKCLYVFYIA